MTIVQYKSFYSTFLKSYDVAYDDNIESQCNLLIDVGIIMMEIQNINERREVNRLLKIVSLQPNVTYSRK